MVRFLHHKQLVVHQQLEDQDQVDNLKLHYCNLLVMEAQAAHLVAMAPAMADIQHGITTVTLIQTTGLLHHTTTMTTAHPEVTVTAAAPELHQATILFTQARADGDTLSLSFLVTSTIQLQIASTRHLRLPLLRLQLLKPVTLGSHFLLATTPDQPQLALLLPLKPYATRVILTLLASIPYPIHIHSTSGAVSTSGGLCQTHASVMRL